MIQSSEPTKTRDGTLSALSKIFNDMEKTISYLMGKGRSEARWDGAFAAVSACLFGVVTLIVSDLLTGRHMNEYLTEHPGSNLVHLGLLIALGSAIGFTTYVIMKNWYLEEYILCRNTLDRLKKAVAENKAEGVNVIEKTLRLMHQAGDWLPNLVRYRSGEAVVYGLVAFLLSAFALLNSPILMSVALLIGVIVWLYFRYENRMEADKQIKRLEAWKQKLEDGKREFLESI